MSPLDPTEREVPAPAPHIFDIMDRLLEGNKAFAARSYSPPNPFLHRATPNSERVLIISCMDPRVVPEHFCSFEPGHFAVVRNAGGRVAQATREIAFASAASNLGSILIIHHTDCGLSNLDNAALRARLAAKGLGDDSTSSFDFGEIKDLDQTVRDDVAAVRALPYVSPKTHVRGFVLDLMTSGELREIESSFGVGWE